jgi:hypothetical protein
MNRALRLAIALVVWVVFMAALGIGMLGYTTYRSVDPSALTIYQVGMLVLGVALFIVALYGAWKWPSA